MRCFARILRKELDAGPLTGLRAFLALWRGIVGESDFRADCPVPAVATVASAITMCRAERSMRPLDQVAQQLETLIADALDGRPDGGPSVPAALVDDPEVDPPGR